MAWAARSALISTGSRCDPGLVLAEDPAAPAAPAHAYRQYQPQQCGIGGIGLGCLTGFQPRAHGGQQGHRQQQLQRFGVHLDTDRQGQWLGGVGRCDTPDDRAEQSFERRAGNPADSTGVPVTPSRLQRR